jgi:hypothetical protein
LSNIYSHIELTHFLPAMTNYFCGTGTGTVAILIIKNCLTLGSDHLPEFGFCLLKECFYVTAFVPVCNNDFESFICKKASREGIEVSDGRNEQNMWTNWFVL